MLMNANHTTASCVRKFPFCSEFLLVRTVSGLTIHTYRRKY